MAEGWHGLHSGYGTAATLASDHHCVAEVGAMTVERRARAAASLPRGALPCTRRVERVSAYASAPPFLCVLTESTEGDAPGYYSLA